MSGNNSKKEKEVGKINSIFYLTLYIQTIVNSACNQYKNY